MYSQTHVHMCAHTPLSSYIARHIATYDVHVFHCDVRAAVSQTWKQLWAQLIKKKTEKNNMNVDSGTLHLLGGLMNAEIFWLPGKILVKSYVPAENKEN